MAEQLKLVYQDESINWGNATPTDIDTYDLLADKLLIDGYQQAISTDGSIVDDVVNLWKRGTSANDLASDLQTLDAFLSRVPDLKEYRNYQSIWLRRQQTGESYARQACIAMAQRSPTIQAADLDSADINLVKKYQLGLKREGWWENTKSLNYVTSSPISSLGGTLAYITLAGDRPARVARAQLSGTDGLTEFWAGCQTDRLGETPSYFNPVWHLHLGSARFDSTTSAAADSDASDGTTCQASVFMYQAMFPRVSVVAADLASHAAQRGRYLVLLRAKVTGTTVARVKLENGFLNPSGTASDPLAVYTSYPRQLISNTSYQLYTMGTIDFPANGMNYGAAMPMSYAGLQISAEYVSGNSGYVDLDCLILIPVLNGMVHVVGDIALATDHVYEVYRSPFGDMTAKHQVYNLPNITPIEQLRTDGSIDWSLRPTFGVLAFAAQRATSSVKADTLSASLDVYERWVTMRGNQGAH